MKPYYEDDSVTIYHGDCREILRELQRADLLLTDPPYGINQDRGMGGCGYDSTGKWPRHPKKYVGAWDSEAPSRETIAACLSAAVHSIIWGANYLTDRLPQRGKWLVWNKEQFMPTYSDAELAFTTLTGNSVKMFCYGQNKHRAAEIREHPTQKPVELMVWCIGFCAEARLILDPFMGSGTTLRAAKDLNRKAIGIEIEERYCEIAAKRMAQEVLNFA